MNPEQRRAALLGAVCGMMLSGGYVMARRLARRVQPHVIDWQRAERIALRVAARSPESMLPSNILAELRGEYEELTALSRERIEPFIQLNVPAACHDIEVVDRPLWVRRNLSNVQRLLHPVEEVYRESVGVNTSTLFRLAHGGMQLTLSAQTGMVLGFLSRHVLGQFDMPFLAPPALEDGAEPESDSRIYFVEPNIRRLQSRLGIPADAFRLWIALHETTHAVQFQIAPWLAGHLASLIETYVESFSALLRESRQPLRAMLLPGAEAKDKDASLGGLMGALTTPDQRELLTRLQAVMCVVEGHGNFVMDELGKKLIADFPTMRQRLEERKRGSLERAVMRLLGFDLKLAQYRLGERFVRHVVSAEGMPFLNRVWNSDRAMPTLDEINAPERWVARMRGIRSAPHV